MSEDMVSRLFDQINILSKDINANLALHNQELINLRNDIKNMPTQMQVAFDERYVRKDDVEHIVRKERTVSDERYMKNCVAEEKWQQYNRNNKDNGLKKTSIFMSIIKIGIAIAVSVATTLTMLYTNIVN